MKLDEMIIKANADGKTYYCNRTDIEYSKLKGFTVYNEDENRRVYADVILTEGWKEKQLRHLTVSEAEKELDCVIDTDFSKLFRSMSEKPDDNRNVIIVSDFVGRNTKYCGFCDWGVWKFYGGNNAMVDILDSSRWIDPADLIKLLPKE